MILSHKIRLNPTAEQAHYFRRACGTVRFAFNWGLARWKELHEAGQKTNAFALNKEFNAIKATQFPWTAEVSARCTLYAFQRLGKAFDNFFRRVKNREKELGYPRFKSKHDLHQSFYVANNALKLNGYSVYIPRCGWVNTAETLRFSGKIMSAVVSYSGGYWWIAIAVEMPNADTPLTGEPIGVDLGVKDTAVCSNGWVFENQKHLDKQLRKLRRLNKELSRRQKGSKRRDRTKAKLTRLHYRIRCARQDSFHKMTTAIAKEGSIIGLENLNVRGMMQNGHLARAVAEVGMYEIKRQLIYKAKLYGAKVVEVGRFFPSSRLCHACGWKNEGLELSHRQWTCQGCGEIHDRDLNASFNIRDEALRLVATSPE